MVGVSVLNPSEKINENMKKTITAENMPRGASAQEERRPAGLPGNRPMPEKRFPMAGTGHREAACDPNALKRPGCYSQE